MCCYVQKSIFFFYECNVLRGAASVWPELYNVWCHGNVWFLTVLRWRLNRVRVMAWFWSTMFPRISESQLLFRKNNLSEKKNPFTDLPSAPSLWLVYNNVTSVWSRLCGGWFWSTLCLKKITFCSLLKVFLDVSQQLVMALVEPKPKRKLSSFVQ